jgi:hypothetical protein
MLSSSAEVLLALAPALSVADLGATNRFRTSEALGFVVATTREVAAGGSKFAAAETVRRGAERPAIAGESRAWERERGEIRSVGGEWSSGFLWHARLFVYRARCRVRQICSALGRNFACAGKK